MEVFEFFGVLWRSVDIYGDGDPFSSMEIYGDLWRFGGQLISLEFCGDLGTSMEIH